jgi:NADH dehydrogenase
MDKKTQIVVVGGGAGGLELVRRLGARFGNRKYDVILLERNGTHVWKPLLHEVAAGSLDANLDEIGYRDHAYRWRYRFFCGSLEGIDRASREVIVAPLLDDDGSELIGRHRIRYDYLVLATGSVTNDFGTPGVAEHCLVLDERSQADRFRQKLLNHCFRAFDCLYYGRGIHRSHRRKSNNYRPQASFSIICIF